MSRVTLFLFAIWFAIAIAGIGSFVGRGSAEVPEGLLWQPSDDSTDKTNSTGKTDKDEAMAEAKQQKSSMLPPIDLAAPKKIETATFALG